MRSRSLIVALGTRAIFRHLDATFPKYFLRMFGEDAPFEVGEGAGVCFKGTRWVF